MIDKVRKPGIVNHHGYMTSNGRMVMTGKLKRSGCGMLRLTRSTLKLRSRTKKKPTGSHHGCLFQNWLLCGERSEVLTTRPRRTNWSAWMLHAERIRTLKDAVAVYRARPQCLCSQSTKKLAGDKINSNQPEDRTPHLHNLNLSCYRHINLLSERTIKQYLPFVIPTSEYENRRHPSHSR